MRPAIFLDRDGTLNVEKEYLYRIEDWEWVPGAFNALRRLRDAGYAIIVVTNQSGIARGYYSEADLAALHQFVNDELAKQNLHIDAFYYCPHLPEISGACACRKPKPGMLLRAAAEHQLDLSKSWMIGDKVVDIQAGEAAGVKTMLVRTGYGRAHEKQLPPTQLVVDDLAAACNIILR